MVGTDTKRWQVTPGLYFAFSAFACFSLAVMVLLWFSGVRPLFATTIPSGTGGEQPLSAELGGVYLAWQVTWFASMGLLIALWGLVTYWYRRDARKSHGGSFSP